MTNKEAIAILLKSQIFLARHCGKTDMYNAVELALMALEERTQGEWITENIVKPYGVCNLCGVICEIDNFCGNCGADMRVKE